jgi:Amt family ammonium transporter
VARLRQEGSPGADPFLLSPVNYRRYAHAVFRATWPPGVCREEGSPGADPLLLSPVNYRRYAHAVFRATNEGRVCIPDKRPSAARRRLQRTSRAFLQGILSDISTGTGTPNPLAVTIPETVYLCFQLTFAIITPALIAGAFAERMKFSAMLWFIGFWSILVYAPIAHWVWGSDGFMSNGNSDAWFKVLDFAGGTVVHINAGVAGLMCAICLGKRKDFGPPHNMVLTFIGAAMLWVGWFGFNAGSAVTAGMQAGMAMTVTQIATAVAGFTWMLVEWVCRGKPTVIGICSGAVAGLVAITPASGFVGPVGAMAIGVAAGVLCYWGVTA